MKALLACIQNAGRAQMAQGTTADEVELVQLGRCLCDLELARLSTTGDSWVVGRACRDLSGRAVVRSVRCTGTCARASPFPRRSTAVDHHSPAGRRVFRPLPAGSAGPMDVLTHLMFQDGRAREAVERYVALVLRLGRGSRTRTVVNAMHGAQAR